MKLKALAIALIAALSAHAFEIPKASRLPAYPAPAKQPVTPTNPTPVVETPAPSQPTAPDIEVKTELPVTTVTDYLARAAMNNDLAAFMNQLLSGFSANVGDFANAALYHDLSVKYEGRAAACRDAIEAMLILSGQKTFPSATTTTITSK